MRLFARNSLMLRNYPAIFVPTLTATDTVADPLDASSTFTLEADGDYSRTLSGVTTDLGDWLNPKSVAGGNYECKADIVSGSLDAGTTGTWLALSSDRSWTRTCTSIATNTTVLTISIRHTVRLVTLTGTITLVARVT